MALNANDLAEAIHTRIEAARPAIAALFQSGDVDGGMRRSWVELATAVVDYLKANAEVTPNGSPAMAAGGDAVTGKGKIQ